MEKKNESIESKLPALSPVIVAQSLSHQTAEKFDYPLQARPFVLKSLSAETRRSYEANLKAFFTFHSNKHPRQITASDVIFWRDRLIKEGSRPSTVATKLSTVRSFFDYLQAAGEIKRNPASTKLVPPPELPEGLSGRALTPQEVRYLLTAPDRSSAKGARDYALMLLMARTFLRVSEAANLRVSAFHWSKGRWTLKVKVKGGRERTIPIPKDVKSAVDEYLRLDEESRRQMKTGGADAFIFQAEVTKRFFGQNRPLTTRHIWHLVRRWALFAGIGKVTPHDLRRTAITRALDLGHTYRQVQNGSGHRHIQSVQRYDHHRQSLEDNSINFLNYDENFDEKNLSFSVMKFV
jgi:site-specific recombinase XerD